MEWIFNEIFSCEMRCWDKAQLSTLLQVKTIAEYLMGQYYNTQFRSAYTIHIGGKDDISSKLYLTRFPF